MFCIRDVTLSDVRGIARIHAKAWKATYRGIIPDPVLDGMSEEAGSPRFELRIREHLDTKSPYPFLVAIHNDQIVGFSHAIKPEDPAVQYDFVIKAIYVDPSFQGMGAGSQLILETAERMIRQGLSSMVIWAASQNPWRRFYDKIGGKVIDDTQTVEIGGKQIPHTVYGWDSIVPWVQRIRSSVRIRKAVFPSDEKALFDLSQLLSPDETMDRFREDMVRASGNVFVAEQNNTVLGFISYSFPWWNNVAMALHFAVDPNHRRKGTGTLLLNLALKAAKAMNCTFFTIRTAKWNTKAIALYERSGFAVRAVFPDYLGENNEMVWLEKDLR